MRTGLPPRAHRSQSNHPQCLQIRLQDRFLLGALVGVHLPQLDDRPQRLDVEAVAFSFRVDVADVVADRLLLELELLDALNDRLDRYSACLAALGGLEAREILSRGL